MKKLVFILIACATLAGCGGGSGGSPSSTPATPTYTVAGTISGLNGPVTLQDNGGDTITVSTNGAFTFPTALNNGSQFAVTVSNVLPTYYSCSVAGGTGTLSGANVTGVAVTCAIAPQVAMACGNATSIGSGNSVPMVVDGFPCAAGGTVGGANNANVPYVSIKICAPGSTTNCQIIDHVTVDTGSTGLRIAASALSSTLQPGSGLPAVAGSSGSTALTECEIYVSSFAYGPVVSADVYIGGKLVKNASMQVFGAPGYTVPDACSSQGGTETDTTQSFQGNGLIGVSFALTDESEYFDCQTSKSGSCVLNNFYNGLPSIVNQFATDNNGVVLSLPPVPASGLSTPTVGALTFGVSTEPNNTPTAGALAIANDPLYGTFGAEIGGTWYSAYIDSGTFVMYFNDPADTALTPCASTDFNAGLYCPATTQNIPVNFANTAATYTAATTSIGSLTYQVANADVVNTPTAIVYSNVAGSIATSTTLNATTVAFGLSTFYGHNMYFLFNNMTAPGTGLGGTATSKVTGPINSIQ